MKNPSLLILLLLPLAAPQWGWGGFRSPLSRSPYSVRYNRHQPFASRGVNMLST